MKINGFLHGTNSLVKEVTDNIEKYELGIAVAKLYDFIARINSVTGILSLSSKDFLRRAESNGHGSEHCACVRPVKYA